MFRNNENTIRAIQPQFRNANHGKLKQLFFIDSWILVDAQKRLPSESNYLIQNF